MVLTNLSELVDRVLGVHPDPPKAIILGTAVVALVAVLSRAAWRLTRNFVTIAHEGGHALAAVLTGRRLSGIRLHSDTSGLTVSKGRPHGPGMVITGLAGYLTPPLMGLGGSALLATGRVTLLLWILMVLLPLMLIMIRNFFGVLSVVATMAIIFGVSLYTSAAVQGAFGYLVTWFLMLGGVRAVLELQGSRRRGAAPNSDADQVGRLTHLPAMIWIGFFAAISVISLVIGGRWLLEVALVN